MAIAFLRVETLRHVDSYILLIQHQRTRRADLPLQPFVYVLEQRRRLLFAPAVNDLHLLLQRQQRAANRRLAQLVFSLALLVPQNRH